MAMIIFEKSGEFNPADYGLGVGDVLNVICVGGGQGGGVANDSYDAHATPQDGGESSFGDYVSSASGTCMGKGGRSVENDGRYRPGAGAGGYLPGLPVFGGHGADSETDGTRPVLGLAGCFVPEQATVSPYCNPRGPGNKGGRVFSRNHTGEETEKDEYYQAACGNGYGAGSPGWNGSEYYSRCDYPLAGGNAGKMSIGSCILKTLDVIPVAVGEGGDTVATYLVYSGGSQVERQVHSRGVDGVVIVTW